MHQTPRSRALSRRIRAQLRGSFVVAAIVAPLGAHAADSGAQLDEVVVTAQKREQTVLDVPASVSSLDARALEMMDVTNIWDLTSRTANVRIDTTNGAINPRIFIRGLGTNDFNANSTAAVSLFVDEVVLANPTLQGMPAFDVDRVEVLRGPQGTLWGMNTTGGIVHVISKKPTDETDGYAKLSYGRYNEINAEGAYGGSLIDGTLSARAALLHQSRDGWLENLYDGRKYEKKRQSAGRLQLRWTPSEATDALFRFHARTYSGEPRQFQGVGARPGNTNAAGTVLPGNGRQMILDQTRTFIDASQFGGSVNVSWNLGSTVLTSITAYEEGDYEVLWDDDGAPQATENFYQRRPKVRQVTQEVRLASAQPDALDWIVGVYYLDDKIDKALETYVNYRTGLFGAGCPEDCSQSTTLTQENTSYAVFGNVDYDLMDALTLSVGVRYTKDDKEIFLTDVGYVPSPIDPFNPDLARPGTLFNFQAPVSKDDSWSKVTWNAALRYELSDTASVFGRVARGYRAGNFNGGAAFGSPVSTVEPETLTSYEVGIKSELMDRRVRLSATAYKYDYEDIQIFRVVTTGGAGVINVLSNAPKGEVLGGEIEVDARLTEGLTASASIGYADTEFTESFLVDIPGPRPGSIDAKGNRFPRSPKTTAQLGLQYDFTLGNSGGAFAYTGWAYQGKIYMNPINADVPEGLGLVQDGYWMGEARVGYSTPGDRFEVTAWVRNITDEIAKTTSFGPFAGMWGTVFTEPRMYGVTFRVNVR
jgi:iron complex outermembrane receptor protein